MRLIQCDHFLTLGVHCNAKVPSHANLFPGSLSFSSRKRELRERLPRAIKCDVSIIFVCLFVSHRQLMFSNILGIWKRLIKYSAILFVKECFMLKLSRKIVRSSQPENAYIVSSHQLFFFCFLD